MTTQTNKIERGIINPQVIDLITRDSKTNEVVLVMMEPRAWGSDPKQLYQLEDKVNRYLAYVLDGFLVKHYPQYAQSLIRFRLDCTALPTGQIEHLLEKASDFCSTQNIAFEIRVVSESDIRERLGQNLKEGKDLKG
ncbi:hypothetical protein K1X76_07520 [bacterium]|nr:hypothetical protein [bacterium]